MLTVLKFKHTSSDVTFQRRISLADVTTQSDMRSNRYCVEIIDIWPSLDE